jgi:hypothetical protein
VRGSVATTAVGRGLVAAPPGPGMLPDRTRPLGAAAGCPGTVHARPRGAASGHPRPLGAASEGPRPLGAAAGNPGALGAATRCPGAGGKARGQGG